MLHSQSHLFALIVAFLSTTAYAAGSSQLSLGVSGTIGSAPEWRNASDSAITSADFSFKENVAGEAQRNVDSTEMKIRLHNAVSYPANVEIKRPTHCSIGQQQIAEQHVMIVHNGEALSADGSRDISNNSLQSFRIRFASEGSYGSSNGTVSCNAGSMVYSY